MRLPPSVAAPRQARRAISNLLDSSDSDEFAASVALATSELINNAVVHGSRIDAITMEVRQTPDWLEVQVQNRGERLRMTDFRTRRPEGGRGLEIVDALVDSWSIHSLPLGGTKVTIRLTRPPTQPDRVSSRAL
jgi:anti-sigma regulatory factor (Ser/Thr protein kinase)